MKFTKLFTGVIAGALLASTMTIAASAAEDFIITPGDGKDTGIPKVGIMNKKEQTGNVMVGAASFDFEIAGEDAGLWCIGGDNGNAGITLEELAKHKYLEISYTCDYPVENVFVGGAFKVHLDETKRLEDEGGYVFNDFLPATWVPWGPNGEKGKGVTVNSLDTFGAFQIAKEGVVSYKTEDLLKAFGDEGDYIMGVGLGTFNNGTYPEDEEGTAYKLSWTEIKLTDTQSDKATEAVENYSTGAAAETTAEVTTAAETTAATTTAAETTSTANSDTSTAAPTNNNSTMWIIIGIVGAVVIIAVIVVVVVKKKK